MTLYYMAGSSRTNISTMTNVMPSLVVDKATTAIHDIIHGSSSSTEVNMPSNKVANMCTNHLAQEVHAAEWMQHTMHLPVCHGKPQSKLQLDAAKQFFECLARIL